jgi:amphi-Trp domain-containing protein
MTDFKHQENVRLSRRQAAERLVDLAYMLTTGGPLEVSAEGEIVRVAVPEQMVFERESRSEGDCVTLGLELRWSSGAGSPEIT